MGKCYSLESTRDPEYHKIHELWWPIADNMIDSEVANKLGISLDVEDSSSKDFYQVLESLEKQAQQFGVNYGNLADSLQTSPLQAIIGVALNEVTAERLQNYRIFIEAIKILSKYSYLPLNGHWDDDVLTQCLDQNRTDVLDILLVERRARLKILDQIVRTYFNQKLPEPCQIRIWFELLNENRPQYLDKNRPLANYKRPSLIKYMY